MSDHEILIDGTYIDEIGIYCSCGWAHDKDPKTITLDELNRIAHEHIEAADRAPLIR